MFLIFPEQLNNPENINKVYEIVDSKNLTDIDINGENKIKLNSIKAFTDLYHNIVKELSDEQ